MVVVLIFFLFLIIKHDIPFCLFDIGFEHLIGRIGQLAPLIELILEVVVADIGVAIGDADVVAFGFEDA